MVRVSWHRAFTPIALGMALLLVGAASPGTGRQHHPDKLAAADGDQYDGFGGSVATDGDTIVIGASGDDDAGSSSGSAYVFVRTREGWEQSAKLTAADGDVNDRFGGSVAIDGDTIVIGARSKRNAAGLFAGAVYMFARTSGGWLQSAEFLLSDTTTDDHLGTSVAIDGDTVVAGAPSLDFFDSSPGAAYVYARTSMGWAESAILTAADGGSWDAFGASVAVSGTTIVVGAAQEDAESAYVFTRSRSGWDESATLTASDSEEDDRFGWLVAIDGNAIFIGAPGVDDAGDGAGSVYVFARARSRWVESGKLTAPDAGAGDVFGRAVAAAGGTIVVGAYDNDGGGSWSGVAYAFGPNRK